MKIQNLKGTWKSEPYVAAFPRDNDLYPTGPGKLVMYLAITRQEGELVWGKNVWRFENSGKWNSENLTGVITKTGEIRLVEDDTRPQNGSSGTFQLTPTGPMKKELYVVYEGIGKGITFTTNLKQISVEDIIDKVKDN
jgi:hypothetical protein